VTNEKKAGRERAHDRVSDGTSAAKDVERDIAELLGDVERERDEYLELAKRAKADFENYRKRVASEAAAAEKRGRAELARALLPVLDNLDRALAVATAEDHVIEGVRLVRDELAGVLQRNGVESYEPQGEPFDPHLHEAMMARPAPADEAGKVVEVLEKGYRLDGQILRPARVIVGASGGGDDGTVNPGGGLPSDGGDDGTVNPAGGLPPDGK
jgi:molecular chaperone GrpE